MDVIFYNNPVGTQKICFTEANGKSASQLKADGVIPKESKTITKTLDPEVNTDLALLVHVDKLVFDDYDKPRKIEFDLDLVQLFFLEIFKGARADIFKDLDSLQLRAMMASKTDIMALIESDKEKLRNLPDNLDYSDCKTFFDISAILPEELLVDYNEKYGYMLK